MELDAVSLELSGGEAIQWDDPSLELLVEVGKVAGEALELVLVALELGTALELVALVLDEDTLELVLVALELGGQLASWSSYH